MHRRTIDSNNKISLETFEDAESVFRNNKSKKGRQHNDQKKRVKTSNGVHLADNRNPITSFVLIGVYLNKTKVLLLQQ
jgi:hypothetical protein